MLQLRSLALALSFSLCAGSLGCLTFNHSEADVDRTPVVNTGAGATILYPGRSVAMPPPVHPSKIGNPPPQATGSPAPQGAPPGYPPSQGAPAPYGQPQAAPQSSPQGYPPQPGYPPQSGAVPPSQPPQGYGSPEYTPQTSSGSGGGMTMLGGATVEEDYHVKVDEEPLYFKYLMLPFAVAAAPFKYAYDKARGEHEPGPAVPTLDQQAPPPQPSAAPQDYESRRLEQMERELLQQSPRALS